MAKRTAKKKKDGKHTTLVYSCTSILKRCKVSVRHPRIGPNGSTVEMVSRIPEAKIAFKAGSPFSKTKYTITKGSPITATVVNGPGTYKYDIDCKCKNGKKFAAPPSMIVP